MPVNITDVDEFTSPVVAPVGSDPANAASVATPLQQLANRTRNIVNRVGGADGNAEFAYPTPRTRTIPISMVDGLPVEAGWILRAPHLGPPWEQVEVSGLLVFPLNAYLREAQAITSIRAMVRPGALRAGAAKMELKLISRRTDWLSPGTVVTTELAFGTHGDDVITWTGITATPAGDGHSVEKRQDTGAPALFTYDYFLTIRAGTTAAPPLPDLVGAVYLVVNDYGPRNV